MAKFIQYPSEFSNTNWTSVAHKPGANQAHVAVGNAGAYRVARSADGGVTWTYPLGLTDAAQTRTWTAVTWNPGAGSGLFIAVASGTGPGRIMTSADGVTWTVQTYSTGQQAVSFNAAASSLTRTVIVGGGGVAADQTITTTNGTSYTSVASPAVRNWTGVSWNNVSASANWVAVANDGAAAGAVMTNTETDIAAANAWTSRTAVTAPTATPWVSVAAQQVAGGVMVAVASSGTQATRIMTSADNGTSWTSRDPNVNVNFSYVFATSNGYYALGTTGTQTQRILTSADGVTWTVGAALPTTPNKWAGGIGNAYTDPSFIVFVSNSGGPSRILRMGNTVLTLSSPVEINDSYTRVKTDLPTYINLDKVMLLNPIDEGQINLPQAAGSTAQDFVTLSFGADPTGITHEIIVQDIINASSPKSSTSLFGYIASELPQNRTVIVTRS
jgi:hypothetical protein